MGIFDAFKKLITGELQTSPGLAPETVAEESKHSLRCVIVIIDNADELTVGLSAKQLSALGLERRGEQIDMQVLARRLAMQEAGLINVGEFPPVWAHTESTRALAHVYNAFGQNAVLDRPDGIRMSAGLADDLNLKVGDEVSLDAL